jgi:hypothetical protein
MDGIFDSLVMYLTNQLGLSGTTLLAVLATTSLVARLVGKAIPDDKTGFVGFVRDACKVIGLYISNRIESGVSVSKVAKVVADSKMQVRGEGGKFKSETVVDAARKLQSPWPTSLATFMIVTICFGFLTGCTITQRAVFVDAICHNVGYAQQLLDSAADSRNKARAQLVLGVIEANCPLLVERLDTRKAEAAGVLPVDAK